MNDDALSPELELASAYLDGDVDDVQRAQVEASPELMALVASIQQVTARLADTPPPDPGVRDAAVAAALAEFDAIIAAPIAAAALSLSPNDTAPNDTTPNVVPMRHRTRWSRVMLVAAAVVLLGVVGVTAIKSLGGSSDQNASTALDPTAKNASDAGGAEAAADTAGGAATPQTIGAINSAAAVIPEIDEPAQLNTLNDTSLFATGAVDTTGPAVTTAAPGGDSTAVATTTIAAAAETTAAASAGGAPAAAPTTRSALTFQFDCPLSEHQVIIAEITWKGTPAVAVRDTVSGVTQAIDANCNVLASSDHP